MKTKTSKKKLGLNKNTIADLNVEGLTYVKGGVADTDICPVGATEWSYCNCQTEAPTCPATCPFLNCPTIPPQYTCDPGATCVNPKTTD